MQFSTWAVQNKLPFSRFTIYSSCLKVYQKSIERLIFDILGFVYPAPSSIFILRRSDYLRAKVKSLCGQKHASLIEIKRFTRINRITPINTSSNKKQFCSHTFSIKIKTFFPE